MARFRRRASAEGSQASDGDSSAESILDSAGADADATGTPDDDEAPPARYDRARGPFDESESESAASELPRLDLGSLLIPGMPGIGVQVEADQNTQEVRAVTAVGDQAAVQLQAFAAPRSEGLWDEIRAEMLAELQGTAGAKVTEGEGFFGPEVRGVLPARSDNGQQVTQQVRFVGIDGPRWFLRVVFLGRAAVDPDPEDALHQLVRETIVVRGTSAMAPRDPLPLTLPAQPVEADAAADPQPDEDQDGAGAQAGEPAEGTVRYADLDPFERGPEITEIR